MQVYSIKDWDKHFEVAQTRKVVSSMKYVPIPTKHDGKSYRRLMRRRDGMVLFAAWVLIVQVAGKCPKRGLLADEDGPLTPDDLADKTGGDSKAFAKALEVLSDEQIGWLVVAQWEHSGSVLPASTTDVVESGSIDDDCSPNGTERNRTERNGDGTGLDRTEQNGTGLNGTERDRTEALPDSPVSFGAGPAPTPIPDSPGVARKKGLARWKVMTEPLYRLPHGSTDYRSDDTSAEKMFNERIWPEGVNGDGSSRLERALALIRKSSGTKNRMAYLTSLVKKEFT